MKSRIIDTHCHLDIIQEQGQEISVSLEKAKRAGVEKILQIGIDLKSSELGKKISWDFQARDPNFSKFPKVYYTIGCHPTETHEFPKSEEIQALVLENREDPNLSAIGEIGIDLYHTSDTEKQQIHI